MDEKVLLGRGKEIKEVPQAMWMQHLAAVPGHSHSRLDFMTEAHKQVRNFAVKELVKRQRALEPEYIAAALNLPLAQASSLLEELEHKLFFLFRNEWGSVAWAYPVTVDATPHKLIFGTGERLYAA